jgi:hypothetical protein
VMHFLLLYLVKQRISKFSAINDKMMKKGRPISNTSTGELVTGNTFKQFVKEVFHFLKNAWNTAQIWSLLQQTVRHVVKQGVNTIIDTYVAAAARDVAHEEAIFSGEKISLWFTSAQQSSSFK